MRVSSLRVSKGSHLPMKCRVTGWEPLLDAQATDTHVPIGHRRPIVS